MKNIILNIRSLSAGVLMASLLMFPTLLFAGQAPTGTYTASMGQSAGTASGGTTNGGRGRVGGRGNGSASGTSVTMNVSSYSTKSELDQLRAAQDDISKFLSTLNSFNHGSVTISGQTFTVNAATSVQAGDKYYIYLLTSTPLASSKTGRGGRQATGAAGGYIRLTVDSNGAGDGMLYASTQVVISTNGEITARGGASTATQLSSVARQ